MGSVEVLGVGSVCTAVFATCSQFGRLAPSACAPSSSSCRRSRRSGGASTSLSAFLGIAQEGHVRHVRWSAPAWTCGRHTFDLSTHFPTRAIADTSTRASLSDADDAVVNRIAVLVSAATSIPIKDAKAALSARPEVVRTLTAEMQDERDVDTQYDTHDKNTHVYDQNADAVDRSRRTARAERRVVTVLHFLIDEVGLSAADVSAILTRNPETLCVDVLERARPVFAFIRQPISQGGAGLSKQTAAKCVRDDINILTKRSVIDVKTRFKWLVDTSGCRASDAFASRDGLKELRNRAILREQNLEESDLEHMDDKTQTSRIVSLTLSDDCEQKPETLSCVFDFLVSEVGLGTDETKSIVRKYPAVLTKDLCNTLRPAFGVLQGNLPPETTKRVIKKYPNVLTLTPGNLQKKFLFFEQTCLLERSDINRVVSNAPSVLTLSVDGNLQLTWVWMCGELGLGVNGARSVLTKAPNVFGLSRDNLERKVEFLISGAGRDAAIVIVIRAPGVLGTSLELNIQPTIGWILETCATLGYGSVEEMTEQTELHTSQPSNTKGGTWDQRAVDVLQKQPSLLGMSVARKLAPTVTFLTKHFPKITASAAFRACTFSFQGLVTPRVFILVELGLLEKWVLGTFLAWSVDVFCQKTGVTRDEYDDRVTACEGYLDAIIKSSEGTVLERETSPKTPTLLIRSAIRRESTEVSVSTGTSRSTPAERARARRAEKRHLLEQTYGEDG